MAGHKRTDIDEATVEAYREAAYELRVGVYKREEADRWLAEMQARHQAALRASEHGNGESN